MSIRMPNFTRWVSIDPGKTGAMIFWIDEKPLHIIRFENMDLLANKPKMPFNPQIACIEKVGGVVGDGPAQAFEFGYHVGLTHRLMRAKGAQLFLIAPKVWTSRAHAGLPKALDPKERTKKVAETLYPLFIEEHKLIRAKDQDVLDALVLGHVFYHRIFDEHMERLHGKYAKPV